MLLLLLWFWLIVIPAVIGNIRMSEKIVNGYDASITEYPYQASLINKGEFICGASIISKNTIITAAHCVKRINTYNLKICVGSKYYNKGQKYQSSKIIIHPDYDDGMLLNDIAVIKLAKPLKFSENVKPIKIQPLFSEVPDGTTAYVSGWGILNPIRNLGAVKLQAAKINVISNEKCEKILEDYELNIPYNYICAIHDYRSACLGDSGGPLIANNKLIGVVSWGLNECDAPYPGIYTNVSYVRDFIDEYL